MRDGVGSSVERRDDVLLCQIVCIDFKNRQQRHDHVSHVALETQVARMHFFQKKSDWSRVISWSMVCWSIGFKHGTACSLSWSEEIMIDLKTVSIESNSTSDRTPAGHPARFCSSSTTDRLTI